jgi:uncharacterized protein
VSKDDAPVGQSRPLTPEPTPEGERIQTLDYLRGIAVMGILGANIIAFGHPVIAGVLPQAFLTDPNDPGSFLLLVQFVLIDGKMRTLFTLLFGAGLWLFFERARQRGEGTLLAVRRLGLLALAGLMHFHLLWEGDILLAYALCGLVALLFIGVPARDQLILGLLGYTLGAAFYGLQYGGAYAMELGNFANAGTPSPDDGRAAELIMSGDYAGFVANNVTARALDPFSQLWVNSSETLPLILMGMALMRLGFFERGFGVRWSGTIGLAAIMSGGLLTLGIGLWMRATQFDLYATFLAHVSLTALPRLAIALGLIALLATWSPRWNGWLAQRVRAAGRAAFTNYIGTSFVMLFVFHGWALGLFGMLSRPQLYIVAALGCVAMLVWSKPWLERFRYGPLEWLWRCLTYGRWFALRRS